MEAGDPREVMGWLEGNHDAKTSSYTIMFIQQGQYMQGEFNLLNFT